DVDLAGIVNPRHAEQNGALRLDHAVDDSGFQVFGVGLKEGPQRTQDFFYGLMELRLVGVTLLQASQESVNRFCHTSLDRPPQAVIMKFGAEDFSKPVLPLGRAGPKLNALFQGEQAQTAAFRSSA